MYAISILTYYLYLYQTGDRKHNHLWSERGGSRAGGGVAARQHEFPSQSITQLLHDILVSLSCGVAVVPRRAVVVGVVAYHWRERIHRIVSAGTFVLGTLVVMLLARCLSCRPFVAGRGGSPPPVPPTHTNVKSSVTIFRKKEQNWNELGGC